MSIDVRKLLETYEFETKLPGSGKTVKFKPITTGVMKKLLVYEDEEDIETLDRFLDDLIQECVITENFNIDELLLHDRFFLLVEIRKKSKGNMFKFSYTCPKCELETIQSVDLSKLEVVSIKENTGPVPINDNLSIELQHLTRGQQKEAFKNVPDNLSFNKRLAEVATYSYALAIKSVVSGEERDENVSLEDKVYLLDSLGDEQYQKIMDWFDKNDFGLDFTYSVRCKNPKCDNKERKVNIPITNFFA